MEVKIDNFMDICNSVSSGLFRSQIFNNYAVGVGAIIGGLGGAVALYNWGVKFKEEYRRKKLEDELKTKYPREQNNITFELWTSSINEGWIYLLDKATGLRHHIASNATFVGLGYDRGMVKRVGTRVFEAHKDGDEFLTRGERYS